MTSTITIHVGGAGNRVALEFWKRLNQDHGVDNSGRVSSGAKSDGGTFYRQASSNRVVPRAVLVDLEPSVLDVVRASPIGNMFRPDNYIFSQSGAGNNWAKGHYTEGVEIIQEVLDAVGREAENAPGEKVNFMIFHALGGGTGGGLGTLIALKLRDEYPDACITSAAILSSPRNDDVVVRPYNEVLALHVLIEKADLVAVIDNGYLYDAVKVGGVANPTYAELNELASRALCLMTSAHRMPKTRRLEPLELARALTPRNRLIFAGLAVEGHGPTVSGSVAGNVQLRRNRASGFVAADGDLLSAVFMTPSRRSVVASQMRRNPAMGFRSWYPAAPPVVQTRSADPSVLMMESHTGIAKRLREIVGRFDLMFKRKAFVHWYTGEGMDEMEFQQARNNVNGLITEYGQVA